MQADALLTAIFAEHLDVLVEFHASERRIDESDQKDGHKKKFHFLEFLIDNKNKLIKIKKNKFIIIFHIKFEKSIKIENKTRSSVLLPGFSVCLLLWPPHFTLD